MYARESNIYLNFSQDCLHYCTVFREEVCAQDLSPLAEDVSDDFVLPWFQSSQKKKLVSYFGSQQHFVSTTRHPIIPLLL